MTALAELPAWGPAAKRYPVGPPLSLPSLSFPAGGPNAIYGPRGWPIADRGECQSLARRGHRSALLPSFSQGCGQSLAVFVFIYVGFIYIWGQERHPDYVIMKASNATPFADVPPGARQHGQLESSSGALRLRTGTGRQPGLAIVSFDALTSFPLNNTLIILKRKWLKTSRGKLDQHAELVV